MPDYRAGLIVLSLLAGAGVASAQEVHAGIGYAHVFRAGGFSFATGYLQELSRRESSLQQRLGGDFWFANTDVASLSSGNMDRSLVGLGARYELELAQCCGSIHPLLAVPVQVLHSSIPDQTVPLTSRNSLLVVPTPGDPLPAEDQSGSAWGWGAGVELGLRVSIGAQWRLQTSGTAMYQDIYAQSATHGAWTWHMGLSYWLRGRSAR